MKFTIKSADLKKKSEIRLAELHKEREEELKKHQEGYHQDKIKQIFSSRIDRVRVLITACEITSGDITLQNEDVAALLVPEKG